MKNVKPKKKKKAEKRTLEQRCDLLNDQLKVSVCLGIENRNPKRYEFYSPCCPGIQATESLSFWPFLCKDVKTTD